MRCPAPTSCSSTLWAETAGTEQLTKDFEVIGFLAPLVVVRRRSDGVKGSLEFQSAPASSSTSSRTRVERTLTREFEVIGFMAPLVVVRRRSDGVKGSLEFQHGPPRLYFNFAPHRQ